MQFTLDKLKNIDIEKLNHFYMVFKYKSFTQAAKQSQIPAHVLRHSLKMIETKLDIKLRHPNKQNFFPTDAAKDLFPLCENLINVINAHKETLNIGLSETLQREFTIITTTTFAHFYLPPILKEFADLNPHVTIRVLCGPEYTNNREFTFDVMLANNLEYPGLIKKKIADCVYHFYAAPKVVQTLQDLKNIKALEGQNLLLFSGEHFLDEQIIQKNKVRFVSNSYPFLVKMCEMGTGLLSFFQFSSKTAPKLEKIFNTYVTEKEETYLYYNRFNANIDLVELFTKIIIKNERTLK